MVAAIAGLILLVGLVILATRIKRLGWRSAVRLSSSVIKERSPIEFYERLTSLLESRGVKRANHLTPMEFASGLGVQPALEITQAYLRVRYGGERLTPSELREIETALSNLETSFLGKEGATIVSIR